MSWVEVTFLVTLPFTPYFPLSKILVEFPNEQHTIIWYADITLTIYGVQKLGKYSGLFTDKRQEWSDRSLGILKWQASMQLTLGGN